VDKEYQISRCECEELLKGKWLIEMIKTLKEYERKKNEKRK
jgi:hypothetical protein